MGKWLDRALERAKQVRFVDVALRVNTRYGEDGGGYLSAALAYFGFLSVFPLILVALSAIGFVLAHDAAAQTQWVSRIAGSVPGLGSLIGHNIGAVVAKRAGAGVVGLLGLLWSGTALTNAAGYSLSRINRRPEVKDLVRQKLWSVSSTAGLGLVALAGIVAAGTVAGIHASGWLSVTAAVAAVCVAYMLDVLLFVVSYHVLSAGSGPPARSLLPGALFAAAGWTLLKVTGAWYASRTVAHASQVYGTFGTVVGVLTLLYLASRLFLYGAELNVVLSEGTDVAPASTQPVRRAA
jgi:YihY family inner membrane protein